MDEQQLHDYEQAVDLRAARDPCRCVDAPEGEVCHYCGKSQED